ncbi:MAG TPA: hypothetical protein VFY27_10070 [Woeseiaceae bacterium]|nr:hypothetical protein [Woeseiaceae bacterium]
MASFAVSTPWRPITYKAVSPCQRPLDECVVYDAGNGRADVPDPRGRRLLVDTSLPVMNNVAGERKLDGAPAIVRRSF